MAVGDARAELIRGVIREMVKRPDNAVMLARALSVTTWDDASEETKKEHAASNAFWTAMASAGDAVAAKKIIDDMALRAGTELMLGDLANLRPDIMSGNEAVRLGFLWADHFLYPKGRNTAWYLMRDAVWLLVTAHDIDMDDRSARSLFEGYLGRDWGDPAVVINDPVASFLLKRGMYDIVEKAKAVARDSSSDADLYRLSDAQAVFQSALVKGDVTGGLAAFDLVGRGDRWRVMNNDVLARASTPEAATVLAEVAKRQPDLINYATRYVVWREAPKEAVENITDAMGIAALSFPRDKDDDRERWELQMRYVEWLWKMRDKEGLARLVFDPDPLVVSAWYAAVDAYLGMI